MIQARGAVRILQLGLGPIGREAARLAARRAGLQLVAAVDIDPELAGRDLGAWLGEEPLRGVRVQPELEAALRDARPHVVLQCSGSRLRTGVEILLRCVGMGAHVVSSMEELAYPFLRHPDEARRLGDAARRHGVSVLGTGVNPGFVLDAFFLCLTGPCRTLRAVRGRRVVDLTLRREPLRRKMGLGLDPAGFEAGVAAGRIGHVGLVESVQLVASALGHEALAVEESLVPVVASAPVAAGPVRLRQGQVAGLRQRVRTAGEASPQVVLELEMVAGVSDPADLLELDGDPPVRCRLEGGVAGDEATVAMLLNSLPRVLEAPPGLHTMADLPPVHWRG